MALLLRNIQIDGGLIVTDGSGYDPQIMDSAPWKSLWTNRLYRRQSESMFQDPQNFEYYNREFKCLGKCGMGYGPVYVWQITKMRGLQFSLIF